MKYTFLIFNLFLSIFCFGQDSLTLKRNQGYVEFGGSTAFSVTFPGTINISVIPVVYKNFLFGYRYYTSIYEEPGYPNEGIFHTLDFHQLALGTSLTIIPKIKLTLSTGPAYIRHLKPENIQYERGFFGSFYSADEVRHFLFGWSTKLETNIYASKSVAFTIGAVFNYSAPQNTGGLNIGFLLPFETINKSIQERAARKMKRIDKRKARRINKKA